MRGLNMFGLCQMATPRSNVFAYCNELEKTEMKVIGWNNAQGQDRPGFFFYHTLCTVIRKSTLEDQPPFLSLSLSPLLLPPLARANKPCFVQCTLYSGVICIQKCLLHKYLHSYISIDVQQPLNSVLNNEDSWLKISLVLVEALYATALV